MVDDKGDSYLVAKYDDGADIRERLQRLDAERYAKGDLLLGHLLLKYCAHLILGK